MKLAPRQTTARGTYLRLVESFPLRPLRDRREYDRAVDLMNGLAVRDEDTLSAGEQDYLDALTLFVEEYDSRHHRVDTSAVTGRVLLRELLNGSGMSTSDLGRLIGSQSMASMILTGRRAISRNVAKLLGRRFALDWRVFID